MDKQPFADRVKNEVDAFYRLWRERRWLAMIVLLVLLCISTFTFLGYLQRGSAIRDLKSENADLRRDLRSLEAENKGLRETVAPLIKQAAKEFPGEEIKISLKKLIERLEAESPLRRPISAATATVEVSIESEEEINTTYMGSGGYLAFGKGTKTLLATSSRQCTARQTGNREIIYRAVFTMDAADSAVGRPVSFLKESEYLQIEFKPIPANSKVLGGRVICIINSSLSFEFPIPAQTTRENKIFIRDIEEFRKMLAQRTSNNRDGADRK